MAKTKVSDWDTTAANNTDVGNVGIAGSNSIRLGNDAIQEVMAQIAKVNGGTDAVSDTWAFADPADTTKRVRLDAGNVTAGQTRVLTMPDRDVTLGGEWVTFQIVNISNQANADIKGWPSDAKVVEIIFDSVSPVTGGANLYFRTSTDGGATFASSAGDYRYTHLRSTVSGSVAEAGSASDSQIIISSGVGNAAGRVVSGTIRIYTPGDAKQIAMTYQCDGTDNSGNGFSVSGGGQRRAVADVDAIRLLFSSGNLNSGKVYGRYCR